MDLNFFWKKIFDIKPFQNVKALTIESAAIQAYFNKDLKYLFFCPRELIDLNYNFRFFRFKKKLFVAKICSVNNAIKEYLLAKKVHTIFNNTIEKNCNEFQVIIPKLIIVNDNHALLVTEYLGSSLHEMIYNKQLIFSIDEFYRLLDLFLNANIEWRGFAPRNMFVFERKYFFIDWEDVYFINQFPRSIKDLTYYKLILNWGSIFGKQFDFQTNLRQYFGNKKLLFTIAPFDDFEKTYSDLINKQNIEKVRASCEKVTLTSEIDYDFCSNQITNFELGHLIDDLFTTNISVMYSFGIDKLIQKFQDSFFQTLKDTIINNITGYFRQKILFKEDFLLKEGIPTIRRIILTILIEAIKNGLSLNFHNLKFWDSEEHLYKKLDQNFYFTHYLRQYYSLKNKNGLSVARKRAFILENLIYLIFKLIVEIFNFQDDLEMFFRGSLSQGLVTVKSDIDFEISSYKYPNGHQHLEQLIIDILKIYNIKSEGSNGRPVEKDINITTYHSREFHEWTQLRVPLETTHNTGWCKNYVKIESKNFWYKNSIYLKSNNPINSKLLFLKVRDVIARLSFYNGGSTVRTIDQLNFLKSKIDIALHKKLINLLRSTIKLYEGTANLDLNKLKKKIEDIYFNYIKIL